MSSGKPAGSHRSTRSFGGLRGGFALTEILMAVLLIGAIAAIGAPKFTSMKRRLRLESAAGQLVLDLRRAHHEALKRNRAIRMVRLDSASYTIDFIGVRRLGDGVTFAPGAPDTMRFAPFGPPASAASYTLQFGGETKRVQVTAAGAAGIR